jgi:hypothetical protein
MYMKGYDQLVNAVAAIKSDKRLCEVFVRLLSIGASSQQVRVAALRDELVKLDAPDEVMDFLKLLGNDKIAEQVLKALRV